MESNSWKKMPSTKGHDFNDGTNAIIQCALEVHKILGAGFQEVIYQRALAWELTQTQIAHDREAEVPIYYKGIHLGTRRVDFVVGEVMVELKARPEFDPENFAQVLNYLHASGFKIALLLNFGASRLQIKRLVRT